MEAVEAEIGSDDTFSSVRDELRQMAFDGTLRSEIDSTVDDADLAVG